MDKSAIGSRQPCSIASSKGVTLSASTGFSVIITLIFGALTKLSQYAAIFLAINQISIAFSLLHRFSLWCLAKCRCFSYAGQDIDCRRLGIIEHSLAGKAPTFNCLLVCVILRFLFLSDAWQDSSEKCRLHTRVQLLIVQVPLHYPAYVGPHPQTMKISVS